MAHLAGFAGFRPFVLLRSGRRGRRFESCHPDHLNPLVVASCVLLLLRIPWLLWPSISRKVRRSSPMRLIIPSLSSALCGTMHTVEAEFLRGSQIFSPHKIKKWPPYIKTLSRNTGASRTVFAASVFENHSERKTENSPRKRWQSSTERLNERTL